MAAAAALAVAAAAAWHQRGIGGNSRVVVVATARLHQGTAVAWHQRGSIISAGSGSGGGGERQRRSWCGGEKKLFKHFLNFDVWQRGSLSRWAFCSRRIPIVRFLFEQSYICIVFESKKSQPSPPPKNVEQLIQ